MCSCADAIADPIPDCGANGHADRQRCALAGSHAVGQRTCPPAAAGAVEAVAFETASGAPWTWSCASCTTTCAIAAPNLFIPPTTECSGTVQLALSTASIGISDGPGDYANYARCTWVVSDSGPITVRFSELNTEDSFDFVKLYDGNSSSAPLLGSFAGTAVPGPVTSTGGALTVAFSSDQSTGSSGFVARLTSASSDAADAQRRLVGTVPAALGDLWCIGRITSMCVRSRGMFAAPCAAHCECALCSDLSGQNLTGQLPDAITRLRLLSSMCAQVDSC